MRGVKLILLVAAWFVTIDLTFGQQTSSDCNQPATLVLFRDFHVVSLALHYKLYCRDSLLGRMKTKDVIILETYDTETVFHATTKAPSLNSDKRNNYQKTKTIRYPFSLEAGHIYFVKCGFLNQNVLDHPRQPTIRLLKKNEVKRYLKKPFLKKKVKTYLYEKWLSENLAM